MMSFDDDGQNRNFTPAFREERLAQKKKKPAIFIGVFVGVLIAFVVVWFTFGKYVSLYYGADISDLPVIYADDSIDGMKPETPGGMRIPNRDKLVYERLRQTNADLPVERLLPAVEQPKKIEIVAKPKLEKQPEQKAGSVDQIGMLAQALMQEEKSLESEEIAAAVVYEDDGTPVEVMFKETETIVVKEPVKTVKKAVVTPEQKPESKPEQKTTAKPEIKPEIKENTSAYRVQLVSTRSEKAGQDEWKRLSKKHSDLIAKQPYVISKAVSAKGTFYRLRIGAFDAHKDAKKLCDSLKQNKQECFVVKE